MALFEKSVKRKGAKGSRTVRRAICRQFVFFSGAPLINEEDEVQRNYQEEQRDEEEYCARVTFHDQFRVRGSEFRVIEPRTPNAEPGTLNSEP